MLGDIMSTVGGGNILSTVGGNILSTVGDVQYCGRYHDNCGGFHDKCGRKTWVQWTVFSTVGDIIITVGWYLEYCGGRSVPWRTSWYVWGDHKYRGDTIFCYLSTMWGYHDTCGDVQYCGCFQIIKDDIPQGTEHPTVFTISPTCIMVSPIILNIPHSTQDIPNGTHDSPHGTEHPPRYWTDIIQGDIVGYCTAKLAFSKPPL